MRVPALTAKASSRGCSRRSAARPTPASSRAFAARLIHAWIRAAIDKQILSGDITGLHRTQECAGGPELCWVAEAPRRNDCKALVGRLLSPDALFLGGCLDRRP